MPDRVQVGWGVSEALAAFVTTSPLIPQTTVTRISEFSNLSDG
jgi:hypothetical protein